MPEGRGRTLHVRAAGDELLDDETEGDALDEGGQLLGTQTAGDRPHPLPVAAQSDEAAADVVVVLLDHDRHLGIASQLPPGVVGQRSPGTQSDIISILADLASPSGGPPRGGGRLANVLLWGKDERVVAEAARAAGRAVTDALREAEPGAVVLGPVECTISRVDGRYRQHILVRARSEAPLGPILGDALAGLSLPHGLSMAIDVDPYDML